jgi:hypothetical protein
VVGDEIRHAALGGAEVAVDRAQPGAVVVFERALAGLAHRRASRHRRARHLTVTEPEKVTGFVRDHVLQIDRADRTHPLADRERTDRLVDLHVGVVDLAGVGVVPDEREAECVGGQVARLPILDEDDRVGVARARVVLGRGAHAELLGLRDRHADRLIAAAHLGPRGERCARGVADALERRIVARALAHAEAHTLALPRQADATARAVIAGERHRRGQPAPSRSRRRSRERHSEHQ